MNDLPEISVIVPVHNVAGFVGPCLESLRAQTFADFEVIVVDDGSTDGSADEARAAMGDDPRFSMVTQENAGLSAARNAGLAEAAGRYVAFVDSDDRVAPEFLAALHGAMTETGAPWAACAVRLVRTDGTTQDVSAIHGQAHPAAEERTEIPLDSWTRIVSLWPSAWNKLYERTLIEGMRFVPGTLYEDHPWFQEAADRAERIAYVPRPLYLHTQGRPGQITRDGGERVFEQIAVLDRCAAIMEESAKPDARQGLQRLATRLSFERSLVISDPARRARFARASRDFLAAHGLRYAAKWDRAIAHAWGRVIDGEIPLSVVVVADAAGPPLARSLTSLARQTLRDREVLLVQVGADEDTRRALLAAAADLPGCSVLSGPEQDSVAAARNRGLEAARGHYVTFLDAGDTLAPDTLWLWVEAMLRSGGGLGLSRFRIAGPEGRVHVGTHDGRGPMGEALDLDAAPPRREERLDGLTQEAHRLPPHRALQIHPLPSAKIFRRGRLLESEVRFPEGPFSSWHMILHAALVSHRMIHFDWAGPVLSTEPEDRRLWRAPLTVAEIVVGLERLAPLLDPADGTGPWRATLFARAVWEKLNFADFPSDEARETFEREAGAQAVTYGVDPGSEVIDAYIGPRVRALFQAS